MTHQTLLRTCDGALTGKPNLAAAFDDAWREDYHRRVNALPEDESPAFPLAYLLPVKHMDFPNLFPTWMQERIERALGALVPQMSIRDKRGIFSMLRSESDSAACEEMMAAAAFGLEFGWDSLRAPHTPPNQIRPEFFVEHSGARWAVECRGLEDNARIRGLNAEALETNQCWMAPCMSDTDRRRLRDATVEKLRRHRASGPMVMLLFSRSPWLSAGDMNFVARDILSAPTAFGIGRNELPLALAYLSLNVVQGIWLCAEACRTSNIPTDLQERIRGAIQRGFISRNDGVLLSERDPIFSQP